MAGVPRRPRAVIQRGAGHAGGWDGGRCLTGREVASGTTFRVNFVVNEMYPERVRRAGQLALANGGGFVYLRGDRESPWLAAEAVVA